MPSIFANQEETEKHNISCLKQLQQPTLKIKAKHNDLSPRCRAIGANEAGNLFPTLYLSKIMVKSNVCVETGITNEALGTVFSIVFDPRHQEETDFSGYIVVDIPTYQGPALDSEHRNGFLSLPKTHSSKSEGRGCNFVDVAVCNDNSKSSRPISEKSGCSSCY